MQCCNSLEDFGSTVFCSSLQSLPSNAFSKQVTKAMFCSILKAFPVQLHHSMLHNTVWSVTPDQSHLSVLVQQPIPCPLFKKVFKLWSLALMLDGEIWSPVHPKGVQWGKGSRLCANHSNYLSPTLASHVITDLGALSCWKFMFVAPKSKGREM